MNGNEIRSKIDENNLRIKELLKDFLFHPEISVLMEQNDKIRTQCKHEFIDGVCKYCDAFEGAIYDD